MNQNETATISTKDYGSKTNLESKLTMKSIQNGESIYDINSKRRIIFH